MKASVCSDTGWLKNRSHWIFGSNKLDTVYRSYPIYHEYMNEELCFIKRIGCERVLMKYLVRCERSDKIN